MPFDSWRGTWYGLIKRITRTYPSMILASHNRTRVRLTLANQHASDDEDSIASPDGDYEDIEGPKVEAHVCLARTRRKLF